MCKNISILNLCNKSNDLILETDTNNEHWSALLKIKEREKPSKYYSGSFNKVECNYPRCKKKSLQS